jgi:APA family basic amino acid/polyamine antiporter
VTARAWGDYTGAFLIRVLPGRKIWENLTEFPLLGPSIDYTCSPLSVVIIWFSTVILLRGAKDSAFLNNLMTLANISMLLLVVVAGVVSGSEDSGNLVPFAPHGLPSILQGAGLVFFAFIGFDQVASLTEEVVHPEKNMPIGIVGSLVVSTLIYVGVSLAVVGMASFRFLGETVPIINALLVNACCDHVEQVEAISVEECLDECQMFRRPVLLTVAHIVSGGAIFGLSACCFTSLMGQPRIFMRMAQDGLWFSIFGEVDPETQVPSFGIKITGLVCAFLACFVPLEALANLISLGTLLVFTFVDAGVILLRLRNVSEATYFSIQNPQEKEDQKRLQSVIHQNVVYLLICFFFLLLVASLILRNLEAKLWVAVLIVAACSCGWMIASLPTTWTVREDHRVHGHTAQFNCPWVPAIPLGGVACNTFMMGSLPPSSWLLCGLWLVLGVVVYFSYGIHNSTLGKKSRYSDTTPLIGSGVTAHEDYYESTMNISVREVPKSMLQE